MEAERLTGPEVDMWDEFRRYFDLLQTTPVHEWEDEDRQNFRKAYRYIRRKVVALSRFLVTTTNNAVCGDIHGSFAVDAAGVIVIQDEAAMEVESNACVPLVKGNWVQKTVGWVMCGDEKQLAPTVFSGHGGKSYNEHAATLRNAMLYLLVYANKDFRPTNLSSRIECIQRSRGSRINKLIETNCETVRQRVNSD